jgi:hypothetical protein
VVRSLLQALIVGTVAAVVLMTDVLAETTPDRGTTDLQGSNQPNAPEVQGSGQRATVVKSFGASIRVAPSADAPVMFNAPCGTSWPVVSVERGWVKVKTDAGNGWIGGGRVSIVGGAQPADCSEKRFISTTAEVWTLVPSGCLDLRGRPSREAASIACVGNGHLFTVVDGPFDPGSGEDWF